VLIGCLRQYLNIICLGCVALHHLMATSQLLVHKQELDRVWLEDM